MKNKKKVLLFSFVLVFLCVFTIGAVAIADDVKLTESSALLADEYDIERFNGYVSTNDGLWGVFTGDTAPNMFNALANILFTGTKIIYQVFDKAIELMYSLNILDKLGNIISQLTNNLWDVFKTNYVPLVIVIAVLIVARTFFFENSKEAVKQLAKVVLVLVVAGIWFPRASQYLNKLNDYSFTLQADIMQAAGKLDSTKNVVGGSSNSSASASHMATNTIRNELFTQTIYRPFLLLNYGTTDSTAIDDMYAQVDDDNIPENTGGDYLLSDEFAELTAKDKKKVIEKLGGTEEEPINYYVTADSVGYKIVISLIYFCGVFLYGLPLVAIAFLNVLLQLLALIYSYILPIIALLSLFPKYSNGLVNSIIAIGKIFMGKAFLGLLVLLFSLVNVTMDLLIPQDSMVTALLNLFIKGVIYFLAIKYRKELISKVTMAMTTGSFSVKGQRPQPSLAMAGHGNRQQEPEFESWDYGSEQVGQYTETNPEAYIDKEQPSMGSPPVDESSRTKDDPQTQEEDSAKKTYDTWMEKVSATIKAAKEGNLADSPEAGKNEDTDPQLAENETIEVSDPQLTVEEDIDVADPQVAVPEALDVRDPQIEISEDVEVNDPQLEISEELRDRAVSDPEGEANQEKLETTYPRSVQHTSLQDLEADPSVQYQVTEEQTDFKEQLKNLRG